MACRLLELDPPAANLSFVVGILSSFFYLISGGSERHDADFRELRPGQLVALICFDLLVVPAKISPGGDALRVSGHEILTPILVSWDLSLQVCRMKTTESFCSSLPRQ